MDKCRSDVVAPQHPKRSNGIIAMIPSSVQSILTFITGGERGYEVTFSEADIANRFGLTKEERQSIENDVIAGKPISATPAYLKFFSSILPDGYRKEDEKGQLVFSLRKPEYEVYEGFIRANHAGAVLAIEKGLPSLLGQTVLLPTQEEAVKKIMQYQHYQGCRNAYSGKLLYKDSGFTWVHGDSGESDMSPYVSCHELGKSYVQCRSNRFSLSLFPSLGQSDNVFGLTEAAKASIEADINAHKPISATPAYERFLRAVLSEPRNSSSFSLDTPEYGVHEGLIRANHAGAVAITEALSQLFGRVVRLPNKSEATWAMRTYKHLTRFSFLGDGNLIDTSLAWLAGSTTDGNYSRVAGPNWSDGKFGGRDRRDGYSVVPVFE